MQKFVKTFLIFGVSAIFFFRNIYAAASEKVPNWYLKLKTECSSSFTSDNCQKLFIQTLEEKRFWGNINKNLKKGRDAWKNIDLTIHFVDNEDKEGEFFILIEKGKPRPFLTLSSKKSTLPEIILTLNHELVHYANSETFLKTIPTRNETYQNCITQYEKAVLLDESNAFNEEVNFWEKAPPWFKKELLPLRFNSRFTGIKESTYEKHFAFIKDNLKKDPFFGSKQYILIGEYPKCALEIFKSQTKNY